MWTARRKAIYEEMHLETRAAQNAAHKTTAKFAAVPFSAATAAATGNSERIVRLNAERVVQRAGV